MSEEESPANDWGYGLMLGFDTDDPEFVRGAECGRIWAQLHDCNMSLSMCEGHSFAMHATNAEMALRIAEATGHQARSEEKGDGWIEVTFGLI